MAKRKKLDNLRNELQAALKQQYVRGLTDGTKAIAGVVFEKAKDETKTTEERIDSIIAFCLPSLGLKEMKQ